MNPHHSFFLLYMATMHINKLINEGEFWSLDLPPEDDCDMSCSSVFMCRKISCRGCRRQASIAAKKMTRDHHPGRLGKESLALKRKEHFGLTMASPNLSWKYVVALRNLQAKIFPPSVQIPFPFGGEAPKILALW